VLRDVISDGQLIEPGMAVRVVELRGSRVLVRALFDPPDTRA